MHDRVFDRFIDMFIVKTRALRLGGPVLEDTDVGPVIDDSAADRIMKWIEEAVDRGAKLLTSGDRDGRLIEPTVLTNVPPMARVSCDEVFGPGVHVERYYKEFEDALRWVNNSRFGLQAGVFTKDVKKAFDAYRV